MRFLRCDVFSHFFFFFQFFLLIEASAGPHDHYEGTKTLLICSEHILGQFVKKNVFYKVMKF